MRLHTFLGIALSGILSANAIAQDTHGAITIADAVIPSGYTTEVPVEISSDFDMAGFTFRISVPDGITVTAIEVADDRLPEGASSSNFIPGPLNPKDGHYTISGALNYFISGVAQSFTGREGTVAKLTLAADAAMSLGDYSITIDEVVITDGTGSDRNADGCTFTLTVKEFSYDEGYGIEIEPFAFKEDVEIDITSTNATALTHIAFDVIPQSEFITNELYYVDGKLAKTKYTTSIDTNEDGTTHVEIDRRSSNTVADGSTIGAFGLVYDAALADGIYTVTIQNIEMTDADDNSYNVAPYTTEIYVGSNPKATVTDGVVTYHGNYSSADAYALLTASLPEQDGITIDLTEVSATAEDASELSMGNVILAKDFVSYGRDMTGHVWGTLCLPFAVTAGQGINFYTITDATTSVVTFTKTNAGLAANTPAIFKLDADDATSFVVKGEGPVEATFATTTTLSPAAQTLSPWALNGVYTTQTVSGSNSAYIITANELKNITGTITAKAFHAWISGSKYQQGARIRIVDGDSTTGIEELEQDNASQLIYDLMGRQQQTLGNGMFGIMNGQKVLNF